MRLIGLPSHLNFELLTMIIFVNGGYGPGDADSQEDVDGVTASDVADGRISVLILNGSHFTGKRICSIMNNSVKHKNKTKETGKIYGKQWRLSKMKIGNELYDILPCRRHLKELDRVELMMQTLRIGSK